MMPPSPGSLWGVTVYFKVMWDKGPYWAKSVTSDNFLLEKCSKSYRNFPNGSIYDICSGLFLATLGTTLFKCEAF